MKLGIKIATSLALTVLAVSASAHILENQIEKVDISNISGPAVCQALLMEAAASNLTASQPSLAKGIALKDAANHFSFSPLNIGKPGSHSHIDVSYEKNGISAKAKVFILAESLSSAKITLGECTANAALVDMK